MCLYHILNFIFISSFEHYFWMLYFWTLRFVPSIYLFTHGPVSYFDCISFVIWFNTWSGRPHTQYFSKFSWWFLLFTLLYKIRNCFFLLQTEKCIINVLLIWHKMLLLIRERLTSFCLEVFLLRNVVFLFIYSDLPLCLSIKFCILLYMSFTFLVNIYS